MRLLVFDRPGYGGSDRLPGRSVADVTADVEDLAGAEGWDEFAVAGGSGGGPHALACAAVLAARVTRCAVVGSTSPPDTSGPRPAPDGPDVRRDATSWLAVHEGETRIRSQVQAAGAQIMAGIMSGGPEVPPDPDNPAFATAGPAADDPAAMARLRATFLEGHDGWVDDIVVLARPWGLDLTDLTVPVSLRSGTRDVRGRDHATWLAAAVPRAERHDYRLYATMRGERPLICGVR